MRFKRRIKSRRFKTTKECQKFKAKVRATKEWAVLKKELKERQNNTDPITGKKLSAHAHTHHLNVNNDFYDVLESSNFLLLNAKSHEFLHFLFDHWEYIEANWSNIKDILSRMKQLSSQEWSEGNG